MSITIEVGRLLWVKLGPRGQFKKRPVVVISEPDATGLFIVAGGSSSSPPTLSESEVELPWSNGRPHPWTKLRCRTVVDCSWLQEIDRSQIEEAGGRVPPKVLLKIVETVAKYIDD